MVGVMDQQHNNTTHETTEQFARRILPAWREEFAHLEEPEYRSGFVESCAVVLGLSFTQMAYILAGHADYPNQG